ncbi:NifB/NifX family molybdenum-iron cluster-binding protein [bacterium]|nr:NifB/NifX family molybdenum-iron cluster-binding protein [bacterium]
MKIVFPTDGNKLEDEICHHFGRAKNFLIFNTEEKEIKIYPNPEAKGEAILPPEFLKQLGVDAVICFGLGPRAFNLFKNYKIKTKKAAKRTIKENIYLFQKGKLRDLTEKDVF